MSIAQALSFFQVQLKVLVIIFKVLHGTLLSEFPKVIFPFHRRGMLQVPSLKIYHFMGVRNHDFSVPYQYPFLKALLLSLLEGWGGGFPELQHRMRLELEGNSIDCITESG